MYSTLASFLIIHNTAGLFLPCLKYFKAKHHKVKLAKFRPERLRFMEHYNKTSIVATDLQGTFEWRKQLLIVAESFDVLIVSSAPEIVFILREEFPDKTIIFVAHGEIRYKPWDGVLLRTILGKVDLFYCTTTDLMELDGLRGNSRVRKIDHPVDMDHFKPRPLKPGKLCVYPPAKDRGNNDIQEKLVRAHLKDIPDITFQESYLLPFGEVPEMLSHYDTFYDVKFNLFKDMLYNPDGDVMSRMGEEALAMGMTVIDGGFNEHKGLPEKYTAEVVTESFLHDMKEIGVRC